MPISEEVIIYTSATCGWALRNYAVLFEKGRSFRTVDVKHGDPEVRAEFLNIFPYGLTPGLRHGETLVWESQRINDYLDDAFPESPLLPATAQARAIARQWIHHCDHALFPSLYATLKDASHAPTLQRDLDRLSLPGFQRLQTVGPYWNGNKLSLVDISYHLFFNTLKVCNLPDIALPAWMQEWSIAVAAAPSIIRAHDFMASLKDEQTA